MPKRLNKLLLVGGSVLLVSVLAFASGCMTVGPDYEQPKTEVPAQWDLKKDPGLTPGEADIREWWKVFDDPQLSGLIARSEQKNLDLKAAMARVEQARYAVGIAAGEELPSLTGTGDATKKSGSENDITTGGLNYTSYSLGLEASWEIDLFGRIRRSIEAAEADYQASWEDRADVMVSLYAEVAQNYLTVRSAQARLESAQKNITSQKEVLRLTQVRFDNGLANGLDVAQAQSVLASSESELPPLRDILNQSVNNLNLLVGSPPGTLNAELIKSRPIPLPPESVTVGVPADLLRRRPDIRQAERQLAAATARIGVATADLYPSFTLTGSLGFSATNAASKLFNGSSLFYSVGPGFSWNIFQGGAIRSQIKQADAATKEALYNYEQTVLSALNETDSAFVTYIQQRIRVKALERTVQAQRKTLELALSLYKQGLSDFQNVLDAQRQLFDYDNQLAEAKGNAASYLVLLYKALGGGWHPGKAAAIPSWIESVQKDL